MGCGRMMRGIARCDFRRCAEPRGNIIMVAGACGKVSDWDGQLPLAEKYNVLRFRITGDSERDSRELLSACREGGIFAPHLLGHSLGSLTCCSFCGFAMSPGNAAFRPRTLALVCPVNIPKGSPAQRVLIIFDREGVAKSLPEAVKAGIQGETTVVLAEGHFPFRDQPAWFNREYADFIEAKPGGARDACLGNP